MRGMVDIHCHILPDVDDGAEGEKEAVQLLKSEYVNGVSDVILTPHYRPGIFETSEAVIERQFRKMERYVATRMKGKLNIYLGCEYHRDSHMIFDLREGKRPTLANSKYVLVEFSSIHGYSVIRKQIYDLVNAGYKPIIAHIERYGCIVNEPTAIKELIALGAELQITSGAVLGSDGWATKWFCRKLLKKQLVHYIASDAHNMNTRPVDLGKCAEFVEKKYGKSYAEKIFIDNPKKIIQGRIKE